MEMAVTNKFIDAKAERLCLSADHGLGVLVIVNHGFGCQENLAEVWISVSHTRSEGPVNG